MQDQSITVRVVVTRDEVDGVTTVEISQIRPGYPSRVIGSATTESEFTNDDLERQALLAGALVRMAMCKLGRGSLLL